MSEFGDLKKLRAVLDALDPPMVMIGRCKTCLLWRNPEFEHSCSRRGAGQFVIGYHDDYETPADFGCTLWERRT